jgi:protein TonB
MQQHRTLKAFLLSLLLHLLLLLLFVETMHRLIPPPPPNTSQKIILDLTNFVPPPQSKVHRAKQPHPAPALRKALQKRPAKTTTPVKKLHDTQKRVFATESPKENNVTRTSPKIVKKYQPATKTKQATRKQQKKNLKKKKVRQHIVKKSRIKIRKKRIKKRKSSLADALMGAGSALNPLAKRRASGKSHAERMIRRLYGREFESFTPAQKRFIRKHLDEIQRITQNTLSRNGYPEVAARTGQQGTNIVTFYLHPNGDISGLRLKRRMGYASLDQNTLDVIRLAYMHYPRPKSKTKITFYVNYSLY